MSIIEKDYIVDLIESESPNLPDKMAAVPESGLASPIASCSAAAVTHPTSPLNTGDTSERVAMTASNSKLLYLKSRINNSDPVRPFRAMNGGTSAVFQIEADLSEFEEGLYLATPFIGDSSKRTGHTICSTMFRVTKETKELCFTVNWEAPNISEYIRIDGTVYNSRERQVEGSMIYHDSVFGVAMRME